MPNWLQSLLERNKRRHPLIALIVGGVLIFLDNIGRAQVLRDVYERLKMISIGWPAHLLTWVGAVIALFGFVSLLWPQSKARRNTGNAIPVPSKPEIAVLPPVTVSPQTERIFVRPNITAEYLTALFDEKTDMQGTKLVEPFLDKWIRVSGEVSNINEDIGGEAISVVFHRKRPNIACSFDKAKWEDHLCMLRRGDTILVVGKIRNIERHWLWLMQCELEK